MKPLRIVFAGTPAFGLPALSALQDSDHQVIAVYTQPDRPAGRGRQLQASPIKEWALGHSIPVYQPLNFKDPATVTELQALQADLMVVIAYGLILPLSVLNTPRLGCINVHASLLPRWRGASPIQQAILAGDSESGVTIMQMDVGLDTGAMLAMASYPLKRDETGGSLHDQLSALAVKPLIETVNQLATGQALATPQDDQLATYAHKISKAQAELDWQQPANQLERQIRAYNPWPVAWCPVGDQSLRVYQARVEDLSGKPGTVLRVDRQGLVIACGEQALCLESIQWAGGKILKFADWFNAHPQTLQAGMNL